MSSDRALVLLVEDEALQQRVIALMTINASFAVHAVQSGEEAIEALFGENPLPYRLVLMDCQLPEMDGFECTRHIRQLEKGSGKRIPIVGMTAGATIHDRPKCLAVGMDDFVSKPFEVRNFSAMLWDWVIVSHTENYLNDSLLE